MSTGEIGKDLEIMRIKNEIRRLEKRIKEKNVDKKYIANKIVDLEYELSKLEEGDDNE